MKFSSVIHKEETRRLEQDVRQFNEVLQSISQQGAEYLDLEIHITGGYIDEIIIEARYHDHSGIIEIE